jgi:hypothetical protein
VRALSPEYDPRQVGNTLVHPKERYATNGKLPDWKETFLEAEALGTLNILRAAPLGPLGDATPRAGQTLPENQNLPAVKETGVIDQGGEGEGLTVVETLSNRARMLDPETVPEDWRHLIVQAQAQWNALVAEVQALTRRDAEVKRREDLEEKLFPGRNESSIIEDTESGELYFVKNVGTEVAAEKEAWVSLLLNALGIRTPLCARGDWPTESTLGSGKRNVVISRYLQNTVTVQGLIERLPEEKRSYPVDLATLPDRVYVHNLAVRLLLCEVWGDPERFAGNVLVHDGHFGERGQNRDANDVDPSGKALASDMLHLDFGGAFTNWNEKHVAKRVLRRLRRSGYQLTEKDETNVRQNVRYLAREFDFDDPPALRPTSHDSQFSFFGPFYQAMLSPDFGLARVEAIVEGLRRYVARLAVFPESVILASMEHFVACGEGGWVHLPSGGKFTPSAFSRAFVDRFFNKVLRQFVVNVGERLVAIARGEGKAEDAELNALYHVLTAIDPIGDLTRGVESEPKSKNGGSTSFG